MAAETSDEVWRKSMFNNFASNVGESLTNLGDEFDKMIDQFQEDGETSSLGEQTNQETCYIPRLHSPTNQQSSPLNRATNRVSWRLKAATEQVKRKFSISTSKMEKQQLRHQQLSASSVTLNHSTESVSTKHSKNHNNNYVSKENNFVVGLYKKINNRLASSSSTSSSSSDDDVTMMESFPVPLESMTTMTSESRDNHLLIPPVLINGQIVRDYQYLSLRYKDQLSNKGISHNNNNPISNVVRAIRGETPKSPLKILYKDTMSASGEVSNNNNNNNSNDDVTNDDVGGKQDFCQRSKIRTQIRHASVIIN